MSSDGQAAPFADAMQGVMKLKNFILSQSKMRQNEEGPHLVPIAGCLVACYKLLLKLREYLTFKDRLTYEEVDLVNEIEAMIPCGIEMDPDIPF